MAAAENDLATLAAVRAWLGFAPANVEHDDLLQRLITGCSLMMQRYMERLIIATDYKHKQSGTGSAFMVLRNAPIVRIRSIEVGGVVVPSANIEVDDGTVYLLGGRIFERGRNNIALVYTAGYDSVPGDLEQACIDTIALRWRERDRIGMTSKGLAGETTSFSLADFPAQVRTLMDTYRRMVPV